MQLHPLHCVNEDPELHNPFKSYSVEEHSNYVPTHPDSFGSTRHGTEAHVNLLFRKILFGNVTFRNIVFLKDQKDPFHFRVRFLYNKLAQIIHSDSHLSSIALLWQPLSLIKVVLFHQKF